MIIIKYAFKLSIVVILLGCFTGCTKNLNTRQVEDTKQNNDVVEQNAKIEIPSTEEIVNTLCSDDFGGRLVGSEGNKKAEDYISEMYKKLQLDPLFQNSYYESYTQEVLKTFKMNSGADNREEKQVDNIIGFIKGSDSTKAVVISAHFDHLGYKDGQIIRGALDNASGVSALIRIANTLNNESKNKTFNMDIIIAAFNGEEIGSEGSKHFVKDIKGKYSSIYNINIDSIGGKQAGKISLNNKSKISDKLTSAIKNTFKDNNMSFSDAHLTGINGDERSFEAQGIPNIYIGQENLKSYVHKETDTPDTLDYNEIDKVADIFIKFIETNDGKTFNN